MRNKFREESARKVSVDRESWTGQRPDLSEWHEGQRIKQRGSFTVEQHGEPEGPACSPGRG